VDDVLRLVTEKAREIVGAHLSAASLTPDPRGTGPIGALSVSDKYAAWRDGGRTPDAPALSRLVCRENRPLRLTEAQLQAHPAWREAGGADAGRLPLRGWLAAPLTGRDGGNAGLIQISDKHAGEFTPADEAILVQIAQIASVAVENARLYAESETRRRQAEALAEMARTLTESLDSEAVARQFVESVLVAFGAHSAALRLLEPDGSLIGVTWAGEARRHYQAGHRTAPGAGLIGRVALEARPLWTADIQNAPGITLTDEMRSLNARAGARGVLAVPVRTRGRLLGVLSISHAAPRHYADAETALLQAFADQAAGALENARLYEAAERDRREAEVMAGLLRVLTATLDLDTVLDRVVGAARELCRADLAQISIRHPTGDSTVRPHWVGVRVLDFPVQIEPGKGLGGLVLATGKPARTANYAEDPRITRDYLAHVQAEGIVASLGAPIRIDGQIEGVLFVDRRSAAPFTNRDQAVLEELADHAAIAIRNARVYAESERRRGQAEALAAVGRLLSATLEPGQVARRIADAVRSLLGAKEAVVLRREPDSGGLVAMWIAGDTPSTLGGRVLPPGSGAVGLAAASGRLVATPDSVADPRITYDPEHRARVEADALRAILAVPLVVKDTVVGVLAIGDLAGRTFSDEETGLAEAFAAQAAVALENARLFAEQGRLLEETRRQHAESATLEVVGRDLTSSLERDEVLQRIADRARLLCGCDLTFVGPVDPETGTVTIVAASGARSRALLDVPSAPGRGLAGIVLESGEAMTTDDYLRDSRITRDYAETAAVEGVVALAVVPIRLRGQITGLLYAAHRASRRFTARDVAVLGRLADQAAIALENSRLYAERVRAEVEIRVRAGQQQAIAELSRLALETADLDALMREAAAVVAQTLDVEHVAVLELRPDGESLVIRTGLGWQPGVVGATVPAGRDSQAGYTIEVDEPVTVEDLRAETRFGVPPHLREHGVAGSLTAVIRGHPRPFGVLTVHTRRPGAFRPDDARFLSSVANVLAVAIRRRRAEDDLRQSEERYRLVASATNEVIWDWNIRTGDFVWSDAVQTMMGCGPDELGRDIETARAAWRARIHPEDRGRVLGSATALLDGQAESYSEEYRFQRADGVWLVVLDRGYVARDESGRPVRVIGSIMDLTERKRAEVALRRLADRLTTLHQIDQAMLTAQSPEEITRASLRQILRLVPCGRASIVLLDPEADAATLIAAATVDGEVRVAPSEPITPGGVEAIDRIRQRETYVENPGDSLDREPVLEAASSGISLPLLAHGEQIGTLTLGSDDPAAFTSEQIAIAREVADSLAAAVEDARLFEEVRAGRERLEALSRELVAVQEAERRHVARELHDEIGQLLTGLKLTLETSGWGRQAGASADEARRLVNDLMARVRELSLDLRPVMLDDFGLLSALLWYFERYTARTGIRVLFDHAGLDARFPPDVETAAYRILQEGLTNAARHAGAQEVTVKAWADETILILHVDDAGRGFDPAGRHPSSGLVGMRERAGLLGGRLTVESTPGAGTRVTAELPVDRDGERHPVPSGTGGQ
jgi:PAS domain S-box-containing protein